MLRSTERILTKAETVFQTLGFCPDSKDFDLEDLKRAAFDTINHTKTLADGLKVARCYAENKGDFKQMVKVVSRHYEEYYGRTAGNRQNVKFSDYYENRFIYHVSNALTDIPNTAMVIGWNMQVQSTAYMGHYYFRRDKTYYISKDCGLGDEMSLFKKNGDRLCIVKINSNKEIVLKENKTNFEFEDIGDATLVYNKLAQKKVPIGKIKWDAISTKTSDALARIELLDVGVNHEQLWHIAYAALLIFKSMCLAKNIEEVIKDII